MTEYDMTHSFDSEMFELVCFRGVVQFEFGFRARPSFLTVVCLGLLPIQRCRQVLTENKNVETVM